MSCKRVAGPLDLNFAMKAVFLLILCLALDGMAARADEIKIVAAENFYGGVAKQIAGADADVFSILSNPNQDPHEFTTSASTAKAVADADIVIYNGLGYDSWMEKLLGTPGRKGRVVICVANLVQAKDGDNPHIWYAPSSMLQLASNLAVEIAKRDPQRSDEILRNASKFQLGTGPLLGKIAALKSKYGGTTVTATEPVFGYMADALGLKMLNYDFQVNVMNDTEPSAAQAAAFEKSLNPKTVKILFYNKQVTDPTTERLKRLAVQSGVPIVGVTETQPPGAKNYADWMMRELEAVESGLEGKAGFRDLDSP
jgi:zinc/manganese transport system substrate-binding protein